MSVMYHSLLLKNLRNMMTRIKYLLLFVCLLSSLVAFPKHRRNAPKYRCIPQSRYIFQGKSGLYGRHYRSMLSVGFGPAYMFGDIGGKLNSTIFAGTDFAPSSIRFDMFAAYRFLVSSHFGLKANFVYGNYSGTDFNTNLYKPTRSYEFTSNVFEVSLQGEYFILGAPLHLRTTKHSVYVCGGAGVLMHTAVVGGHHRTFDQINQESLTTPVLPVGIGYEYYLGSGCLVGAQYNVRYVFGDFLDGIVTPDSKQNDFISSLNFTFSYFF